MAGSPGGGFADGDAALFSAPAGLAQTSDGSVIFIADTGNNRIRALNTSSGS